MVTLLCTVRGCRRPLAGAKGRMVCPRRHAFDVGRNGYVSLLQPQDRRSPRAGDTREVRAARRRCVARGLAAPLLDTILSLAALTPAGVALPGDAVLDVGCGEGDVLSAVASRLGCEGHGVDIAAAAIDAAARRYPRCRWVVANADRLLPYARASFRLVMSVTARLNPTEFRRVVRDDGAVLIVVPGADDLVEVREAVLGSRVLRDRVERTVAMFEPRFALAEHRRVRQLARLDPSALVDAMTGAYRALRPRERTRLAALGAMDVTIAHDVLCLRPV